jgi:diphthine synthase
VKEPDYESMVKYGKVKFLPPRFMTVNTAIEQLLEIENEKQLGVVMESTLAVGMARLGQPTQQVLALSCDFL